MKKLGWLVIFLFAVVQFGYSQNAFFAVANGNWNASGVWSLDGSTPIICSPCIAGTDYPSGIDQAYTQGFSISLPANTSFSVSDLYVAHNVALGITRPSLGLPPTLTISGELAAYDLNILDYAVPTTNVIRNDNSTINLVFDGANAGGPVINSWSISAPLKSVRFNPASSSTTLSIDGLSLSNNGVFTVSNGTLQLNGTLQAAGANASVTINSGATLQVNMGNINGNGTSSTSFPTMNVNGTLTSVANTTSYVNCATITLGASAILNVGFNGANQSQGWWFGSNSPISSTLNPTSTVVYNASVSQNISAAILYGNLTLTSTAPITKNLSGTGLTLQGNLTIGANVTFSPASQVDFTGTAAQNISGTGTLNFNGGLEVNKSSSALTLNKPMSVTGFTITSGTLNLGDVTTSVTGATSNSGIITSGNAGTVVVSGTASFFGAGSTAINNLTISSGTTTFTGSSSITGNLTNNGTLVLSSTSAVTFLGGSTQTISGNPMTFGNIVVNKPSATLSNNANVELTGTLTMTTGTFNVNGSGSGNLILNSDTNGDAAIGPMAGGSIVGEVTFERYFNNTSNRWRNIAFPVSSLTYAELGATLTLNPNSLAIYNELASGNVDQGWTIVSGGNLNSARGHSAWMYNIQPITVSLKGPLLQGIPAQSGSPYNFGVTYFDDLTQAATQDGWNLVPNPFASPIDWNNSGWVKTRVNSAAAVWDVESNTYRYSNVDWNGIVAQGQAFWVQTNAASPVLTCTESVKESISDPDFYRVGAENSRLMISLLSGSKIDKTLLQFREEATAEFDGDFDAYKLKNGIYNLSTLTNDGISLAANILPRSSCTSGIKLKITDVEPGTYTFKFEGLSTFTNINSILLRDKFTNNDYELQEEGLFTFEITSNPNSFGQDRFEVVFDFADLKANPVIDIENNLLISNYDEGNQWFFNGEVIAGANGKDYKPLQTGVYFVSVSDGACLLKSEEKVIEEVSSRIFPNPASTVLKVDVGGFKTEGGEILIFSSLGLLVKSEKFTTEDYLKEIELSGIKPGIYSVTIISTNKAILEKTKVVIK